MKLTTKMLKKLIQEEVKVQEKIELGNYKDRLAASNELEKLYGIRPESKKDLNMILSKIEQIHSDKLPSESHYDAMGAEYGYQSDYNAAFNKLPGVKAYDLLKKHLSMDEGHYHDMGDEDEMYNALDMPKRLSPKEIFGEFQNFVEVNNLSRADVEGMLEMLFSDVMDVSLNESPSMEHITPENIMMVISVLKDLGLLAVPAAAAAMGINRMLDKTGTPEAPEK